MSKIAIVTDSTSFLPAELIKKHNITVTPQILIWGEETYRDGVDIQPAEFYARLTTAKTMPTTSQVPLVVMQSAFQNLVDQGYEVIGLFVSSKFSGTVQSAMQGKDSDGSSRRKSNHCG